MFTGIVSERGSVVEIAATGGKTRLRIEGRITATDLAVGDSVAVNGVCLTAIEVDGPRFVVEAVPETLARTNLGELRGGAFVNLERPVPASGRFDGHVVQGHVDGVAIVRSTAADGEAVRLWVDIPAALLRYVVEKGSVALDGVSLTVSGVDESGFEVALIPHTTAVTTFAEVQVGRKLNLEVDVLAKYVERILEARR